jgi:hypothetical protein
LDWHPPGVPSGGFLSREGIRLEGLMSRARSPRAPEVSEGICPLVSCPVRDFVGEVDVVPRLLGGDEVPSSLGRSGCQAPT